jgi:hypothetical protein
MAGALTVDTLNSSTGVLATQNGMTGVAKAWVNFNGTTNTIRSSFNVTSTTKIGTGNYQINLTTAMPNANYAVIGMCQYQNNAGQTILEGPSDATTSSFKVWSKANNNTVYDSDVINVSVFSS